MRRMTVFVLLLALFSFAFSMSMVGASPVHNEVVPTLVPPTLVPTQDVATQAAVSGVSALQRIQETGTMRVGILYNAVPFGLLNIRGTVAGFDADLARSMADLWDVEVEFVQVTRQTALDLLIGGEVDFLAAAQIHYRELDTQVEFSQTYYVGSQAVMVRQDDGAASLADMAGRTLGVVMGTVSEAGVSAWQAAGNGGQIHQYLSIDQALVGLVNGEVDGLVHHRHRLREILQPSMVRILDDMLVEEPYAIAMRRQDANLRDLVNRTLQYLAQNGRLNEIYEANIPAGAYPPGLILGWRNLGEDAPTLAGVSTEIRYPSEYVLNRLYSAQPLRIAGLTTPAEDAPESERRLYTLNRAVVDHMLSRWGATGEYLPDSADNALELLANGQADLAVGVSPDWQWADRVDFTAAYLLHGQRLMVKSNSQYESFNDLRGGRWIGVFASEPGMASRVNELAASVNTAVNIFTMVRDQDVPFYILEDQNADVAFGDSLKLIPHLEAYPNDFRMATRCAGCDPWYSREYVGLAVPENDLDFRLLVEYTLQEMRRDGTLDTLSQPVMLPGESPSLQIWPGPAEFAGFSLGNR